MRITMLNSVASRTTPYPAGHTFDVEDAFGKEQIRAGHARAATATEDPDFVVLPKHRGARRTMEQPAPSVTADVRPPAVTAVSPVPGVTAAAATHAPPTVNAPPAPASVKPTVATGPAK